MAAGYVQLLLVSCLIVLAAGQFAGVPHCPDTYGLATTPSPESCHQFYKCENGTLTLETCENGLLFDGRGGVHNHCNYHWAVQCDKRISEVVPISTPGCEYQFGIYPKVYGGCDNTYIKCAHGIPYETPCEPGLAYDEVNHSCNWPDLLLERCNPEQVVGFRCPDKVEPDTLAYTFWPYPRFAIPGECGRLITCVNGYPRLITCEHGTVFNEASLTCQDPAEVRTECGRIRF